jgi:mono/diheme cytochrome c family protein
MNHRLSAAAGLSTRWPGALIFAGWICCLCGQDKAPVSVWDGIYTVDQAERGQAAYRKNCASCHGGELEGKGQNPPLAGSDFTSNWNGMSVGDLLEKIQLSMPADRPGKLSKDQNAETLAYILKYNKFPAGAKDLPASADDLRSVRFEAEQTGK